MMNREDKLGENIYLEKRLQDLSIKLRITQFRSIPMEKSHSKVGERCHEERENDEN